MKPGVYVIESSDLREFLHSRGKKARSEGGLVDGA